MHFLLITSQTKQSKQMNCDYLDKINALCTTKPQMYYNSSLQGLWATHV